ncbi:uncharacterized protein A4U43_C06F3620 [Asparagus officinalis]|uniref:Uncharacterized protein n=1 Tax=Asparagus officinalis TaxID=4686 RepID=A0A5P1ELH1_ASPOF|nr:uncharacterized protein A4U43_C06F3620 [Asparagus officinalis]
MSATTNKAQQEASAHDARPGTPPKTIGQRGTDSASTTRWQALDIVQRDEGPPATRRVYVGKSPEEYLVSSDLVATRCSRTFWNVRGEGGGSPAVIGMRDFETPVAIIKAPEMSEKFSEFSRY